MLLTGIMRAADPTLYSNMWDAVYNGTMLSFVQDRADQIGQSSVAVPLGPRSSPALRH
jgi:hypothetical protein